MDSNKMWLKDIKVVELATVLAGPVVGTFFSELGAKVIKFENSLKNGDVTRSWKTKVERNSSSVSSYYASANYHKEVRMVNLKSEEDQQKVYNEIKDADIVISNFKPHSAEKLGMDYETISKVNSTIIYGCINGYGDDDTRPAFDAVLQAECGLMYMNGTEESGPLKWPLAMVDLLAAHQLKEGIMVALFNKFRTNKGAYVSVSLYDSAIATLSNQGSNYLMNDDIPQRLGSKHPGIAPYGDVFISNDRVPILLAVGNNQQFHTLLKVLNLNHLISEELFSTNALRVKNREAMIVELSNGFKNYNAKELIDQFNREGVPSSIVQNLKEVFENKKARELIVTEIIDEMETKRVKSTIFNLKPYKA